MQLNGKAAVVHGAGGVIGGAVARAFAREGCRVFLAGRTLAKVQAVADAIRAEGGQAEAAQVDALDEAAVEQHAAAAADRAGGLAVAFNAIGVFHVQGTPVAQLSLADFELPVTTYIRSNYLTARAASRHMAAGGAVLMLTTPAGRMPGPGFMGHAVACAGVEALSRHLAGELGAQGIRVVCMRSHAIPETVGRGSHAREVFGQVAAPAGMAVEQMLEGAAAGTLLKRLPTLDQLAQTAVFLASDGAGAITGAVVNLNAGFIVD